MCYSIFTVFINNVTESASRINDYFYSILFPPSLLIYVTRKVISIMLRGIQDQTNLQNPPINPDPNVPSTIQGHTHAIHCLSSFNTSHKWCIKLIGKRAMSFEDYILHTCWRQAHGRVWGGWLCNGKIFSISANTHIIIIAYTDTHCGINDLIPAPTYQTDSICYLNIVFVILWVKLIQHTIRRHWPAFSSSVFKTVSRFWRDVSTTETQHVSELIIFQAWP